MTRLWLRCFLLGLALVPAVGPLLIIHNYGVDIPYQDDWHPNIANLFIKAHQGQLWPSDFFGQHNEHRIVVPRLIYFFTGTLTHGNKIADMIAVWVLACATSLCMWRMIVRAHWPPLPAGGISPRWTQPGVLITWFMINAFVFTPWGWENWSWGMGVVNILPPLWLMGALLVVDAGLRPWVKAGLAAMMCLAATYTAANGAFLWLLIGPVLVWSDSWAQLKEKRWILLAWAGAFGLSVGLYLINFQMPKVPANANPNVALFDRMRYVAAFLGGPFAFGAPMDPLFTARIIGSTFLALWLIAIGYFVWVWRFRRQLELSRVMLPWIALAGLAVLSALSGSLLRANLFKGQAVSSRYSPFAVTMPIALIWLVPMICRDWWAWQQRKRSSSEASVRPAPAELAATVLQAPPAADVPLDRPAGRFWLQLSVFLSAVLMIVHYQTIPRVIENLHTMTLLRERWKGAVLLSHLLPQNAVLVNAAHETLPELLTEIYALNTMGYLRPPLIESNVADRLAPDPLRVPADAVTGLIENSAHEAGVVQMAGWAAFPNQSLGAHSVFLAYENESGQHIIFTLAESGRERTDIAQRLDNSDLARCGWVVSFPTSLLPASMPKIKITAWAMDAETAQAYQLSGDITLTR